MPDLLDLTLTDPAHPLHLRLMGQALAEAETAFAEDEVPVGAVVFDFEAGVVVAAAHNQREQLQDPTAHAEMVALTQAAHAVGSWRLDRCALYATLEPCPMCAGGVVNARVPLLVYGATDPKAGACDTLFRIPTDARLNHRARVVSGVRADECAAILTRFFAAKRALGKK
jgi:tRNA(adenine34) deaminase